MEHTRRSGNKCTKSSGTRHTRRNGHKNLLWVHTKDAKRKSKRMFKLCQWQMPIEKILEEETWSMPEDATGRMPEENTLITQSLAVLTTMTMADNLSTQGRGVLASYWPWCHAVVSHKLHLHLVGFLPCPSLLSLRPVVLISGHVRKSSTVSKELSVLSVTWSSWWVSVPQFTLTCPLVAAFDS